MIHPTFHRLHDPRKLKPGPGSAGYGASFIPAFIAMVIFSIAALAAAVAAFDGDASVITGDNVRVRSAAKTTAPVAATLRLGTVVRVLGKSDSREKLGAKDAFGYYWYQVDAGNKARGWVYGQFLYGMNGDRFAGDSALVSTPYAFSGKEWYFGVAEEPAYPVSDDTGLTGSIIHAAPFFYDEKAGRALFISCDTVAFDLGEPVKPPALFRLNDSDGGTQKITSIAIDQKKGVITMEGVYETQIGGGKFSLTARILKDRLVLASFKKAADASR